MQNLDGGGCGGGEWGGVLGWSPLAPTLGSATGYLLIYFNTKSILLGDGFNVDQWLLGRKI